jgi:hypothetical protein
MAVLGRSTLDAGIRLGRYIKNPRTVNGIFPDLQNASSARVNDFETLRDGV